MKSCLNVAAALQYALRTLRVAPAVAKYLERVSTVHLIAACVGSRAGRYQAYYNAVASLQKFESNKKAVVVAEKSFGLATKRYEIGMLNTIDYLTNQNNLFTARINVLIAQYDYVFRIKVLEYYKGLGIKL